MFKRIEQYILNNPASCRVRLYLLVTLASTIFIVCNWDKAVSFTFFTKFDGINLLFIIWICLLLGPVVGSFEGFGLKWSISPAQREERITGLQNKLTEIERQASGDDET